MRVRGFLRNPRTAEECRSRVRLDLEHRAANLVTILRDSVYGSPRSPYRALLEAAGAELPDVVRLIEDEGVEGALATLRENGVFLRFEEFKGRSPIVRGSLELAVRPGDFDNPATTAALPGGTGGSRGPGTRLLFDLEHVRDEGAHVLLFADAHGMAASPLALWRPTPPGFAGIYQALSHAAVGRRVDRWFSQNGLALLPRPARGALTALYTVLASRGTPTPIPYPERAPLAAASRVATWLAARRREGRPGTLNTTASCGVRVAAAAVEAGLDLEGTLFELTGEPVTEAKAALARRAGARVAVGYYMSEVGRIGLGCATPSAVDDVHVATDKLAVLQWDRPLGDTGRSVGAFLYTTLRSTAPRILLNVEADDYGVLEERACGCPLGQAGLRLHVHGIRSYDKLSSEGMSFLGGDLLTLVEEVLPARFGGAPGDYQLVEEELDGLPRVTIVASPRVGPLDEEAMVGTALEALARPNDGTRLMAAVWRAGGTVRVARREPHETGAGKVLPLHVPGPVPGPGPGRRW